MAHRRSGARDKAIGDYRRVLQLEPKDQSAAKQLEELESGK